MNKSTMKSIKNRLLQQAHCNPRIARGRALDLVEIPSPEPVEGELTKGDKRGKGGVFHYTQA